MNICPNCFEELEESRLLYELYFYEGYGLSTIMDKVAGGSDIVKVIAKERDDILYERYLDETIHYHIGRDDGYTIEAFREMICHIREDYLEARKRATEYLAGASGEDAKQKLTQSGLAVLELGDAKEDRSITMYIRHNNGFRDEIARLLPCCPNCHKSLPLYWYEADCFEAVAIIAQKAASKTTMIVSLLANQCSALRFLDEELQVLPAHDPQKDPFYKGLEEQSRLLEEARTFAGSGPCLTALLNGQGQESAAALRPRLISGIQGGRLIMEKSIVPSLAVHTGPGLVGIGILRL